MPNLHIIFGGMRGAFFVFASPKNSFDTVKRHFLKLCRNGFKFIIFNFFKFLHKNETLCVRKFTSPFSPL